MKNSSLAPWEIIAESSESSAESDRGLWCRYGPGPGNDLICLFASSFTRNFLIDSLAAVSK